MQMIFYEICLRWYLKLRMEDMRREMSEIKQRANTGERPCPKPFVIAFVAKPSCYEFITTLSQFLKKSSEKDLLRASDRVRILPQLKVQFERR